MKIVSLPRAQRAKSAAVARMWMFACASLAFACSEAPRSNEANRDGGIGAGVDAASPSFRPMTFDEYCDGDDTRTCVRLLACGLYADRESCEHYFAASDSCARHRIAFERGLVDFDGVLARRCADHQASFTTCRTPFAPPGFDCRDVFAGKVMLGSACDADPECKPGSYCRFENVCPGACAPRRSAGEAVERESDLPNQQQEECERDLYVYDGRCAERPSEGESCAPIAPSTRLQICEGFNTCATETLTCVPFRWPGETCESSALCLSSSCEAGTCARPSLEHESCAGDRRCALPLVCIGPENAPTCEQPRLLGGACDETAVCGEGLFCRDGQCRERASAGEICDGYFGCELGSYCADDGPEPWRCVRFKRTGEPCASRDECEPGWCDGVCRSATCY